MGASQNLSSLSCELKIIRAKNVESKRAGFFFIRYYLSAGNSRTIRLNSREISSKYEPYWGESFSLDCLGSEESIQSLMQESFVFELRWRSKVPLLGKIGRSQILGRGEIAWKTVMESPEMEIKNWVPMVSMRRCVHEDFKPPALEVGIKVHVHVSRAVVVVEKRGRKEEKWNECGCSRSGESCSCVGYEIIALAAAFEVL